MVFAGGRPVQRQVVRSSHGRFSRWGDQSVRVSCRSRERKGQIPSGGRSKLGARLRGTPTSCSKGSAQVIPSSPDGSFLLRAGGGPKVAPSVPATTVYNQRTPMKDCGEVMTDISVGSVGLSRSCCRSTSACSSSSSGIATDRMIGKSASRRAAGPTVASRSMPLLSPYLGELLGPGSVPGRATILRPTLLQPVHHQGLGSRP